MGPGETPHSSPGFRRFPNRERGRIHTGGVEEILCLLHDLRVDRKSTRLNSSHIQKSRMPSSA